MEIVRTHHTGIDTHEWPPQKLEVYNERNMIQIKYMTCSPNLLKLYRTEQFHSLGLYVYKVSSITCMNTK